MTPREARHVVDTLWGARKQRNLDDPRLGGTDTWHDAILAAEEVVEDALRRVASSSLVGPRLNIVRRNAINDAVRKATHFAPFYSRILYVSTEFLQAAGAK